MHRQSHAFFAEAVIELGDAGGSWLVNERMVDIADGGTSIDTGETIDR